MTDLTADRVEIGVTGAAWVGRGTRSIWSLVRDSFDRAEREVLIAAYSLSESSPEFYTLLDSCLIRDVRIFILVNRLDRQPEGVKQSLMKLKKKYNNFIIKTFDPADDREDLHAKLIVIDHRIALVGSANPTWKGMVINHELVLRITGRRAGEIGDLIDRLARYHKARLVTSIADIR